MKVALVSDNGKNVSQHFGRARYYVVVTVENGQEVNREVRDKLGHSHFDNEPHDEEQGQHGFGPGAQHRHGRMIEAINDCEAIVAGGMGSGARESLQARGIRPILTDIMSLDDAVKAYVEGRLEDHAERIHR
ncbi:MAG: NifB/NifX family molybdenum-iron cluster-binding protein [Candidatus Bathyarchaeia archaeon]